MYRALTRQDEYELSYKELKDEDEESDINGSVKSFRVRKKNERHSTNNSINSSNFNTAKYDPSNGDAIEDDFQTEHCFERSFLYHYMVYTFQYCEKDPSKYRSVLSFQLFRILRWVSILLTLGFIGFRIYLFHLLHGEELGGINVFKKILTVLVELLWILKYPMLHFIGVYSFWKYPLKTPLELKYLFARTNSRFKLTKKLKKTQRSINKIIAWTLFSLVTPAILVSFLPVFLEFAFELPYPWKSWEIELFNALRIVYIRLISLPFLFYLIHISSLQILSFEEYIETTSSPENTDTMDESFQKYLRIHLSVQESVKNYRMYLRVIFGVLLTFGTVYSYFALGLYKTMMVKHENTPEYSTLAFDYFAEFLKALIETLVLFWLPFWMLHLVGEEEKALSSRICEISYSKMPSTFPLNNLQKILDFVRRIEKFQKNQSIGYQVFGGSLSRIKTVWLIALSPIAYHLANSIIKGKL